MREGNFNNDKPKSDVKENLVAVICYVSPFLAIPIFFRFKVQSKFVSFHAIQSMLFSFPLFIILYLDILPYTIAIIVGILVMIITAILAYKSYKNEFFKLPIIGNFADRFTD